jgi:hypothetical protein
VGSNSGTITNCSSTGSVSGTDWCVGGLVGENGVYGSVPDVPGHIIHSYSTGDVNGVDVVGGLVGINYGGSLSNCYSTGDVNGVKSVGGLVGANGILFHARGDIFNSYSTGDVNGIDYVGGLVGSTGPGSIKRSFWDVETSGKLVSAGGTGKTTAEMKTKSTFTSAGWDFIEIWGIGENQTYPYLRTEPAGDFNIDSKVDLFDLAILASHWLEEN